MKLIKSLAFVICAILLTSCLKTTVEIKSSGDAMIISKFDGNKVVYGLSIYAYTNGEFKSVEVTSSAEPGKSFTLKSDQGVKTNFIYDMPESEYSATKPAPSTYTFTATFTDGTTQVFTDDLEDKVLPLPSIEKCTYNTQMLQLEIGWTAVEGASSYAINVLNGTSPVYWSNELTGTTKSFSVTSGTNGWASNFYPETGKTYTLRLYTYLYEDQGNRYNIQAVSFTDKTVIWGK
jgi:hypothetical protein